MSFNPLPSEPRFAWHNLPPEGGYMYVPIVSPEPFKRVELLIVGWPLVGIFTHYQGDRTVPCYEEINQCAFCQAGYNPRWKGYLACYAAGPGRKVIGEITAGACRACPDLVDPSCSRRGYRLELMRMGTARNSLVRARLLPPIPNAPIPDGFPVEDALLHLWGFATRNGKGVHK
jgi:hypothetical protein